MAAQFDSLPEELRFLPWRHGDPPPYVIHLLDKEIIFELARITMQAQKEILTIQAKAVEQGLAALGRVKTK